MKQRSIIIIIYLFIIISISLLFRARQRGVVVNLLLRAGNRYDAKLNESSTSFLQAQESQVNLLVLHRRWFTSQTIDNVNQNLEG